MAILAQITLDGVTKQQYDALSAKVESGEVPAEGCLAHVAVVTPTGVEVTDVWESQAAMDTFTSRLTLAAREVGFPQVDARPRISQAHTVWIPGR
ncbi:hypothetical protein [Kitasatospora sp. NBC_00315]|uniref:hypothetical protein n=1 Tax=Kitasatospora sp. NBC_00315 TaxID=2975963 RepID=UPI0032495AF3